MVQHLPVLLREVIEMFSLYEGCHYLDATFGGGGHTRALLERDPSSKVTVLDCDPEAYSRAVEMSKEYENRLTCYNLNFDRLLDASLNTQMMLMMMSSRKILSPLVEATTKL